MSAGGICSTNIKQEPGWESQGGRRETRDRSWETGYRRWLLLLPRERGISWLLSHVSNLLSDVSCLLSSVFSCLPSRAACLSSLVSCLSSLVVPLPSPVYHLPSQVSWLSSTFSCLPFSVNRLRSNFSCLLSPASCLPPPLPLKFYDSKKLSLTSHLSLTSLPAPQFYTTVSKSPCSLIIWWLSLTAVLNYSMVSQSPCNLLICTVTKLFFRDWLFIEWSNTVHTLMYESFSLNWLLDCTVLWAFIILYNLRIYSDKKIHSTI